MKKNFVLKASVAALLALSAMSANAGTQTAANTTFATENFGPTATAAVAITPGAVSYSMGTSTTVNAASKIYFVIRLAGGTFKAATPVAADFSIGGGAAGANVTAVVLSTDRTTAQVEVTAPVGGLQLGLGALVWTPSAGGVDSVTGLSVAGATVTATTAVTTVAAASAAALDSANALPASVDGTVPTTAIATSATAVSAAVSALAGYTNKIDLTASPVASVYTLRVVGTNDGMALGSVTFSSVAGVQNNLAGAADYTVDAGSAGGAASATITVTPGTGQAFPIGSVLSYDVTSNGCIVANQKGALAAITAATSTTTKTLAVAAADLAPATPIFVCMTAPSATNTASPITATLVGTTVPAVATDAATTVTGAGYAVDYNGSSVDVRNYVPAAVAGWTQYIRVINTGSVSAAVSMATIDETTGAVGTSAVVATLAPGAAKSLDSATIEAAIGAVASTARPRIRVTAPTNGMDVQNILFTPNGSFTAMQGKE